MKKFVREFDLFSKPFVFFVGDKKSKATLVGGFLSLSILVVSIVYFYYLINMYFSNKIEPKITSSISIENDSISIDIEDSFFIFEMLINGEPLKQYEKRVGKTFLTYSVIYEQYALDGTYSGQELPLVECPDLKFQGFLCVDAAAIKGNNLYMQPINKVSSDFTLSVHYCDDQTISNCATPEEIYSTILQPYNYFQIFTKIRQYNPSSREYYDGYKSEYLYFDPNQLVFTRIVLIKATTTVTEGMLIQTSESSEDIFDFKRIDTYFSKDKIYERMGVDGFAYIVFEINQIRNIIVVQHAMITEVLAQFMSIFNSLLTIGILAKLLAESHIVEDMNSILLKEYYKKTALQLVCKKEKKEILNKITVPKLQEKKKNSLSSNSLDESHVIASLQKKIKETDFIEQSKKFFEMSFFERFKIFIYQLTGKHPEVNLKDQGSDSKIFQHLLNQSVKRINIFEVYKDLIKLKMAIKIMLTKEQYAAMQFCGSDILEEQSQLDCRNNQIHSKEIKKKIQNNEFQQSNFFQIKSNIVSPTESDIKQSAIFSTQRMNLLPSIQQSNNDTIQSNNNIIKMIFSKDEFNPQLDANESPTYQVNQQTNIEKNTSEQPIPFIKSEENTTNNNLQDQFEDLNKKSEKITQNDYQSNIISLPSDKQTNIDLDKQLQLRKNNGDTIEVEQLYEQSSFSSSSQEESEGKQQQMIQKKRRKDNKKSECIEKNLAETQKRINLAAEQEHYVSDDVNIKNQQFIIHNKEADSPTKQIFSSDLFHTFKSHLQEMDFIEESDDLQEQLLKKFLENVNSNFQECQDITKLNHIDRQIFQSLLIEKIYK